MIKKIIFLFVFLPTLFVSIGYASKLSSYLNKMEAQDRAKQQKEWQEDMNFGDFAFRLDKRYRDERGQYCRDYVFRSRSNPYRHGFFTVCDER